MSSQWLTSDNKVLASWAWCSVRSWSWLQIKILMSQNLSQSLLNSSSELSYSDFLAQNEVVFSAQQLVHLGHGHQSMPRPRLQRGSRFESHRPRLVARLQVGSEPAEPSQLWGLVREVPEPHARLAGEAGQPGPDAQRWILEFEK